MQKMKRIGWLVLCILLGSIMTLLSGQQEIIGNAAGREPRVLFISSYSYEWPSVSEQLEGIQTILEDSAELNYMFMDTKVVDEDIAGSNLERKLLSYYKDGVTYDAVILGDDAALRFALEYRDELFTDTPLVYEGINNAELVEELEEDEQITGVFEQSYFTETIEMALRYYPDAEKVLCITDSTVSGKGMAEQFWKAEDTYPEMTFTMLDCSEGEKREIQRELASCGEDTILIYSIFNRDSTGKSYTIKEATDLVTKSAKVPVFTVDSMAVNGRILGGACVNYEEMANTAGRMVKKILRGREVSSVAPEKAKVRYYADQKVLDRFELNKRHLPKGTKILNQEVRVTLLDVIRTNPVVSAVFIACTAFFVILVLIVLQRREKRQKMRLGELVNELTWMNKRFRRVIEHINMVTWVYDMKQKQIIMDDVSDNEFGNNRKIIEDVPESLIQMGAISPKSAEEFWDMHRRLEEGEKKVSVVLLTQGRHQKGWCWEKITYVNELDEDGKPYRAIGFSSDVTAEVMRERQIRALQMEKETLVQDMYLSAVYDMSKRQAVDIQSADQKIMDLVKQGDLKQVIEYFTSRIMDGNIRQQVRNNLSKAALMALWIGGEKNLCYEYQVQKKEGPSWELLEIHILCSHRLTAYIYVKDIQSKKEMELQLKEKAEKDSMTKVYNHATFESMVEMHLQQEDHGKRFILGIIDVDEFKQINDTFGHRIGDNILCQVALELSKTMKGEEAAGRLGGDEFAFLMIEDASERPRWQERVKKIHKNLSRIELPDGSHVGCSFGTAKANREDRFGDLYERADRALYDVKRYGKNGYRFG